MGFMDKLKNIFFEDDEDDEIEEPIALQKEKKEEKKKEVIEPFEKKEKVKNTIARKIEIPKKTRVVEEEMESTEIKETDVIKSSDKKVDENEKIVTSKIETKPKINTELIFDDDDFNLDIKPKVVKEKPKNIENKDTNLYRGKNIRDIKSIDNKPKVEKNIDYSKNKAYANSDDSKTKPKTFTPSPIISPIYGILDKNYKKEEVKENKEIRISSRPSRMDLDSVRNKAFGDLEYDLMGEFKDTEEKENKKEKKNTEKTTKSDIKKIYNLNKDDDKPSIDKVTIGEADEYYNDLGLAYNTDYKDLSKDINDGKVIEKNDNKNDNLEDNLFDLIESMYDREE